MLGHIMIYGISEATFTCIGLWTRVIAAYGIHIILTRFNRYSCNNERLLFGENLEF